MSAADSLPESALTVSPNRRRWYDAHPEVQLLLDQPDAVRGLLTTTLIHLAERDFQTREMLTSSKSLGPARVLAMFKARNKRRKEDQDANLLRLMNYLTILPSHEQALMLKKLAAINDITQAYHALCRDAGSPPDPREAEALCLAFLKVGEVGARKILAAMSGH